MALHYLDLSHNQLHAAFGAAIAEIFPLTPSLTHINLSHNPLGAEGGAALARAVQRSSSLRKLDLTSCNLCNCNPKHATTARSEWRGDAIEAIAAALLAGSAIQTLVLSDNQLAGLWSERIGGGWAMQGTYTTAGLDALIRALETERLHLRKRGGLEIESNLLLKHDLIRVEKALFENEKRPKRPVSSSSSAGSKPAVVAEVVIAPITPPKAATVRRSSGFTPRQESEDASATAAAQGDDGDGNAAALTDSASAEEPLEDALEAEEEDEAGEERPEAELGAVGADVGDALVVDGVPTAAAPIAPAAAAGATSAAASKPKLASAPAANGPASAVRGTPRTSAPAPAAAGKKRRPSVASAPAKAAAPIAAPAAAESKGSKLRGLFTAATKGEKKKKAAAEPEPEADPFASLPMYIARIMLGVRKGWEVESETVKDSRGFDVKFGTDSLCRVVETHDIIQGITKTLTRRMKVVLDGDAEPSGWVTGLTRDGTENLKLAAAGFPLRRTVKPLVCREEMGTESKKLDEVPKHILVRVLEEVPMPDGVVRAKLGKGTSVVIEEIGWVTSFKPGDDDPKLEPPPILASTFDLKGHTATFLSKALKTKQAKLKQPASAARRKHGEGGLPWQPVGRHPAVRSPDDGTPSRHANVAEPATMQLMFNCHGAAFEITHWTGGLPFELPDEQSFDLYPKGKKAGGGKAAKGAAAALPKRKLGRVGLARDLKMPFLERIEFPDEWVPAEECGLEHDGWQGGGVLELELTCGKDVATLQISPWVAYSCSVGARVNIRSLSASQGQCATVDRILGDDRIVAKVDGFSKTDGVKGEVIVDLQPKTVVPTAGPGYPRGQRLLLLHRQKQTEMLVDAVVMNWEGAIDYALGSRHMVSIKEPDATTGIQV